MDRLRLKRAANHSAAVLAAAILALVVAAFAARPPAHAAVEIQEVRSESGVTAWLVEDYTVPLVAIQFAFKGGSTQDPAGKEGLANLMTGLFDEGAGDLKSSDFQKALDDAGAEMRFNVTGDAFHGSMRTLAETRAEAFGLLRLALTEPRFDQEPVDRIRSQIIAGIAANARDPGTLAEIAWEQALYGGHPYARREEGTPESLRAITVEDLKSLHRRVFARENLIVGVVGAIDAETLKAELDRLFGGLPAEPELREVAQMQPKLDQEIRIDYALPQTSIRLAFPGIERQDPQFFAAYLMNHILGGGTFSSRLFFEVREERGLAYSVGSTLINRDYADALLIGTSTRSDRAEDALRVIQDVVRGMAEKGPTAEELAAAKRYVIGAYAINNLDNSSAIANTLVGIQMEDLGIDYIERRDELIEAVTLEQVKTAAERLLTAKPAVMLVGPAASESGPAGEGEPAANGG